MKIPCIGLGAQSRTVIGEVLRLRGHELVETDWHGALCDRTLDSNGVIVAQHGPESLHRLMERESARGASLSSQGGDFGIQGGGAEIFIVSGSADPSVVGEIVGAGAADVWFEPLEQQQVEQRILVAEQRIAHRLRRTPIAPLFPNFPPIAIEARLRAVIAYAPMILFALDARGTITVSEGAALSAFGVRSGELIGRNVMDLYRDDPTSTEHLQRALRGESVSTVRELSGKWFETRYTPIRGEDGITCAVVGIATDVTERVRAEEAIRRSEQAIRRAQTELRELIKEMPDCVLIRRGPVIIYANSSARKALGEVVGQSIIDLTHEDERARVAARVEDMDKTGVPLPPIEVRFVRGDGRVVSLEIGAVRKVHYEGADAALLVGRDISEGKRLQGQLLLADRMASIGTLAAGVAHEINNPLAYLIGNLTLIGRIVPKLREDHGGQALKDFEMAMEAARDGAERVRLIVRDLMTFSRSDEAHRGPIDVRSVLDASINVARSEITNRARLRKDYGAVNPVYASESRLGQVFLNLLVNAAQAIPEGDVNGNEISVRTSTDGKGNTVVEIRDSGNGMEPHVIRQIFDPFFTTKALGGSGLGLSICHGIVSSLGGEIAVESDPGRGSTFRVVLPTGSIGKAVHLDTAPSSGPTRAARLLVIDDEPLMGQTLLRQLSPPHQVTGVTSARKALERMAMAETFDLIVCDLMMPEMSGMAFYGELESRFPEQAERVVFITGGAFTAAARAFLDRVPNKRLEKPFREETLRAIIADVLSIRRG
ncbi:MAG: hypothetical protein NVSMB1_16140 [Polyangiales bacterium]